MEVELYNEMYKCLVDFANFAGISEEKLQEYFKPMGNPECILERLCSSLQNSGMMRNSIKFNNPDSPNKEIVKKVLFDFDIEKSAAEYSNWVEIYDKMIQNGITDNGKRNKKETNWQKYCRGIFEGLQYLKNGGTRKIKEFADADVHNLNNILPEINRISKNIHGLGLPLTCDWLKECGCTWLAKPDTHITKVASRVYLDGEKELDEKEVLKKMLSWSEAVKASGDDTATAYKIDKIIWLLCTGNFYLDNLGIGRETIFRKIDSLKKVD